MDFMTVEHAAHLAALARAEWEALRSPTNVCDSPLSNCSDASSQCALSPLPAISEPTRRGSQSKKKGPGHISRPPNAFLLFRSDLWAQEKRKSKPVERDHRDISRIAGHCWRNLDLVTKAHYHACAQALKEEHKARYPGYRLVPSARRSRAPKQKSAVVLQKESRCRALAQQLMATTSLEHAPPPLFPYYIPEFASSHLDVTHPDLDTSGQPLYSVQMETLMAPKPVSDGLVEFVILAHRLVFDQVHHAFYSHGFTIEQNTDLPAPLAPPVQTPGSMAECMDALSTLPPLPSYDTADPSSFSTLESLQPIPMFSAFDTTVPIECDFEVPYLHHLFLPIFDNESTYPLDACLTQNEFPQVPCPLQYTTQY